MDKGLTRLVGIGLYRVALLLIVMAQLWLTSNFVKRVEFERMRDDITDMKTALKLMATQDRQITDHEARLRALENAISRLSNQSR